MFCERCGCMMRDGEYTCPECGAYWGPVQEVQDEPTLWHLVIPMIVSAAAAAAASYFLGFYALLFLLFFGFGGNRPRTKRAMILKGISLGLMAGCVIGLGMRYLM